MPIIIIILAVIVILLISTTSSSGGSVDMSTYEAIYNKWYDLSSNWADVLGVITAEEILAIITEESSGEERAFNPGDPSYGLMGVSMLVGKAYSTAKTPEDLYDAHINIMAGAGFLAFLKRKYQNSFPLGQDNGWVQMYNEGETEFLKGKRAVGYEIAFLRHVPAMQAITQQKFSGA